MYSEKDDFDHHDTEVDAFFSMLDQYKLRFPPNPLLLDIGGGQGMHV